MSDLISIVMPVYKGRDYLKRSIGSVLAQTHEDWELLLVSDDGVDYPPILNELGIQDDRIRFLSTGGVATGVSNARNTGIQEASSPYIAVLDCDDEFTPEKLELCLPPLKEYGFVSCALGIVKPDGSTFTVGSMSNNRLLRADEFVFRNFSGSTMILFDREKLPVLYNTGLPLGDDHAFIMDCFCKVNEIFHFGQALHRYHKVENSLSNTIQNGKLLIELKENIISKIESGGYDFVSADTKVAYLRFFELSKEAEQIFIEEKAINPDFLFEEAFASVLAREGFI